MTHDFGLGQPWLSLEGFTAGSDQTTAERVGTRAGSLPVFWFLSLLSNLSVRLDSFHSQNRGIVKFLKAFARTWHTHDGFYTRLPGPGLPASRRCLRKCNGAPMRRFQQTNWYFSSMTAVRLSYFISFIVILPLRRCVAILKKYSPLSTSLARQKSIL